MARDGSGPIGIARGRRDGSRSLGTRGDQRNWLSVVVIAETLCVGAPQLTMVNAWTDVTCGQLEPSCLKYFTRDDQGSLLLCACRPGPAHGHSHLCSHVAPRTPIWSPSRHHRRGMHTTTGLPVLQLGATLSLRWPPTSTREQHAPTTPTPTDATAALYWRLTSACRADVAMNCRCPVGGMPSPPAPLLLHGDVPPPQSAVVPMSSAVAMPCAPSWSRSCVKTGREG